MAGTLCFLHRGNTGGGSYSLGELIDTYGEELYVDLKVHYQVDLAEVLAGTVATSPRLLLALIRGLPEGSRYVAVLSSAPVEYSDDDTDAPAEIDPVSERLLWTEDRKLLAQLINSVNMLVRHSIPWEKGKEPKVPLVGPAHWRGEGTAEQTKPSKPLTVMDVLQKITGTNK